MLARETPDLRDSRHSAGAHYPEYGSTAHPRAPRQKPRASEPTRRCGSPRERGIVRPPRGSIEVRRGLLPTAYRRGETDDERQGLLRDVGIGAAVHVLLHSGIG